MNFKSTFLYIKQHSLTGLKYLGKTCKKDPIKLIGSGTYWPKHRQKHGNQYVNTLWYCLFTEKEELTKFALMISKQWDIVNSDEWANLMPENGLDGGSQIPELMKRWQIAGTAASLASPKSINKNPENMKKMLAASISSPNHISKTGKLTAASAASPNQNSKCKVTCPHCGINGTLLTLSRWHFNRCKYFGVRI